MLLRKLPIERNSHNSISPAMALLFSRNTNNLLRIIGDEGQTSLSSGRSEWQRFIKVNYYNNYYLLLLLLLFSSLLGPIITIILVLICIKIVYKSRVRDYGILWMLERETQTQPPFTTTYDTLTQTQGTLPPSPQLYLDLRHT